MPGRAELQYWQNRSSKGGLSAAFQRHRSRLPDEKEKGVQET
jgi:hypothetical protein